MPEDREEIRIGEFVVTTDDFILSQEAPDGRPLGFLDVTFEGPSSHLLTDAGGFEFEPRFNWSSGCPSSDASESGTSRGRLWPGDYHVLRAQHGHPS